MSPFEISPNWYVYGKRRHVPAKCPRCGCKPVEYDGTISSVLQGYFGAWRIQKVRHWGMMRWGGYCGRCAMSEVLVGPSLLIQHFKECQAQYYAEPLRFEIPKT